jgi:hypothetical protein
MPLRPRSDTIHFLTLDKLRRLLAPAGVEGPADRARPARADAAVLDAREPYWRFDLEMRTRIVVLA